MVFISKGLFFLSLMFYIWLCLCICITFFFYLDRGNDNWLIKYLKPDSSPKKAESVCFPCFATFIHNYLVWGLIYFLSTILF